MMELANLWSKLHRDVGERGCVRCVWGTQMPQLHVNMYYVMCPMKDEVLSVQHKRDCEAGAWFGREGSVAYVVFGREPTA